MSASPAGASHAPVLPKGTLRLLGAAAPLAALFLAVPPAPAQDIAFVSDRDGNDEIYRLVDSSVRRVTANAQRDVDPAFSPDGRRLAIARQVSPGNYDIFTMTPDGSDERRVASSPRSERYPSWSPDGTSIAYRSNAGDSFDIWVVGADGSAPTRVTTEPSLDSEPSWGAIGRIAFMSDRGGNRDVWVMRADGSDVRQLTTSPLDDRFPSFSPDGSRLLYSLERGPGSRVVGIMDADGQNKSMLDGGAGVESHPAWSPDGAQLLFDREVRGVKELRLRAADGSVSTLDVGPGNNYNPAWGRRPASAPGAAPQDQALSSQAQQILDRSFGGSELRFRITAARRQKAVKRRRVRFGVQCDRACTARLTVRIRIGTKARRSTIRLKPFTVVTSAGVARKVNLRLPRSVLRRLRSGLRSGRRLRAQVSGVARDRAGATAKARRSVRLVG